MELPTSALTRELVLGEQALPMEILDQIFSHEVVANRLISKRYYLLAKSAVYSVVDFLNDTTRKVPKCPWYQWLHCYFRGRIYPKVLRIKAFDDYRISIKAKGTCEWARMVFVWLRPHGLTDYRPTYQELIDELAQKYSIEILHVKIEHNTNYLRRLMEDYPEDMFNVVAELTL